MSLFITGKRVEGSWAHADEQSSIYELKAVVENVLRRVGMPQNNVVIKHSFTFEQLEACHLARGFKSIGYHYYIT